MHCAFSFLPVCVYYAFVWVQVCVPYLFIYLSHILHTVRLICLINVRKSKNFLALLPPLLAVTVIVGAFYSRHLI